MGRESSLYFKTKYGVSIASVDLSQLGYAGLAAEFFDLFQTTYTDGLYVDLAGVTGENSEGYQHVPDLVVKTDCYGEPLKYTSIENLWSWCKQVYETNDELGCYRRFALLYAMVKSFVENPDWANLGIIAILFNH